MLWTIGLVVAIAACLWIARMVRASNARSEQAAVALRKRETTQKDLVSAALGSRPPRRAGED